MTDWRAGLSQNEIGEHLVGNGDSFAFLEEVMVASNRGDHLVAFDRNEYITQSPKLHSSFLWDAGTALIVLLAMQKSPRVVTYQKKEVGSLIRFETGRAGNTEGYAFVDYLLRLPSLMELNDAQVVELEFLLNRAGKSLNIPMPVVRPATEQEQEEALKRLALSALKAKPKLSYQTYLDALKAAGTPVIMTQEEFFELAAKTFQP